MGNKEFVNKCIELLVEYHNDNHDMKITSDDVYVVWLSKVLGNNKALLSTNIANGKYYEITYNGAKDEFYFDAYRKEKNICIKN